MADTFTKEDQELLVASYATSIDFASTHESLSASDFDLPQCRFVFEVSSSFLKSKGILPDITTLARECVSAYSGTSTYKYETVPDPETKTSTADLLAYIADGVSESELKRAYDLFPNYIAAVKGRQVELIARNEGWSAKQTLEAMAAVNEEVTQSSGTQAYELCDPLDAESADMEEHTQPRIPTGVSVLDVAIGGGLSRGDQGLVIAGSGLGKTTFMIYLAAYAARIGLRTLFISLENSKSLIFSRYKAMQGHYPMSCYKTRGVANWDQQYRDRYMAIMDKKCPINGMMNLIDGSGTRFSVKTIEEAIVQWKKKMRQIGQEDKCAAVYVDWLEWIDLDKSPGVNKASRKDEQLRMTMQELKAVATRQNVILWTAQQVTRDGQSVEMPQAEHIAGGIRVQDSTDLCISLARPAADAAAIRRGMDGTDTVISGETDRNLVLSGFKCRVSDIKGKRMTVYQSPSLEFWKSKEEYTRQMARYKRMNPADIYRLEGQWT